MMNFVVNQKEMSNISTSDLEHLDNVCAIFHKIPCKMLSEDVTVTV